MKNNNSTIFVVIALIVLILSSIGINTLNKNQNLSSSSSSSSTTTSLSTSLNSVASVGTSITSATIVDNKVVARDTCGLSAPATEGPYYVSGTTELKDGNLNYDNLSGTKVRISGYIYEGATGTVPVSGAKIEIWHADDSGSYHPESNGSITKYTTSQISLRGYVLSDANGYYSYTTIAPGKYEGRARHLHIKASAEGYKTITSQLIFPAVAGDRDLPTTDNIARSLPECNDISLAVVDGIEQGAYNFRIEK
jgi:protocatechuate 3,4-dioxygenase beta subunit